MHVLAALNNEEENSKFVKEEFFAIKDTVLEASKGSFRDLFTMGEDRHFHRVVLAYVNQMFQQISGINLITYYIPNVLQNEVGLSPFLAKLIAACNGTEYFLASWIAVFTVERVGRRKLMLFGAAGMSVCMAILAGTDSIGTTKSGIAETVFLFMFNTCFAIGWLGMTWLYPAEIVPLRIRAPSNAVSTTANWIFSRYIHGLSRTKKLILCLDFMVVMITPVAFSSIGYQTYIIFCVMFVFHSYVFVRALANDSDRNAFIFPVVYFFYPETAGRSLEEMDAIFVKCKSIFTVVGIAKREPRRYGKHGETLISYDETDIAQRRRSSTALQPSTYRNEKVERDEREDV